MFFDLYHRKALKSKHLEYVPIQPGNSALAALSPFPVTSLLSSEWEKCRKWQTRSLEKLHRIESIVSVGDR